MAIFQEEFLRCNCGSKEFAEDTSITISVYAKKVKRDDDAPLPEEVLEKKTNYICKKCGEILDV